MTSEILSGNELLVQGGLEAGFELYTGYPGSPLADFFNILDDKKNELNAKGIHVVLANSESHAAAMCSGAKMAGQNVLVAMKSMGLHVASDALSVGNFANPKGPKKSGVVVVVGDDPWSISTSSPADSRFLFKHLHIPFLEPSTPQELKDWITKALKLSQESSLYVGFLVTTFMAEGGGRVESYPEEKIDSKPIHLDPSQFNLTENVMVPPNSLKADVAMINNRFPHAQKVLHELKLDQVLGNVDSKLALISSGAVFETLKQVLESLNLMEKILLYKAAGSYPLDESSVLSALNKCETIIVVEEKRSFLETELCDLFYKKDLKTKIFGKKFNDQDGFPAFGGLNFNIILEKLITILPQFGFDVHTPSEKCIKLDISLAQRLPTFCPGCPHRETLSIMKELRGDLKQKGLNLISHGDVGCYSLSFLEPFKEMHDLSAMGQGGALGAGADIFTTNPSIVLMGDSTFFHSGMTTISNSVQMGHNITYILLDNDNTAMTGHQVTPRTGVSVDGKIKPRQDMLEVCRSLKVDEVQQVNPSDRYFYKNLLLELVNKSGVKVIVSNKECALTYFSRVKKTERELFSKNQTQKTKTLFQINTSVCEDCRECVEMTGCPGLSQTNDSYGTKLKIDPQICVADSYCTKLKACPSFEMVEISDYHPELYKTKLEAETRVELPIPAPKISFDQIAKGFDFRILVIGVGGSGVTTISRILAEAAREMGGRSDIDFKFVDQKGLAQRNGSVTSHLSFFTKNKSHGQTIPLRGANLILSPDLLEGARALDYLQENGLIILDNDFQIPLSILLDRGIKNDPLSQNVLEKELKSKLGNKVFIEDFKNASFNRFEKSVYSSSMILGYTFQMGRLPFNLNDLFEAIKKAVPSKEIKNNLEAFEMGREKFINQNKTTNISINQFIASDFLPSIYQVAYPWQNAVRFVSYYENYLNEFIKLVPNIPNHFLAQYLHDLMVYDQGKNIPAYLEDVRVLTQKYEGLLLEISLRILTKAYFIKDEVFIAHIMRTPHKNKKDQELYSKLGSKFKVKYINRPSFVILGKKIEFDFSPRDWMLNIMRHLRILRILMPQWHSKEKNISMKIRQEILNGACAIERLREIDNIKGYREIRYKAAELYRLGNV